MDKAIHKHLDARLDIQEEAAGRVEGAVGALSLDALIESPEKELARVAQMVLGIAKDSAQAAVDEGQRFADQVRKMDQEDRKIVVDKDAGPKDNKKEADS